MSTAAEATMTSTALTGTLPGLGQTALSLIVVLGLIFALAWLLKRVQGVRLGGPANLRIHAGLQVGPKEKVLMIEAGGQHLLIGVSAGGVNTLHVFAEPPVAASPESTSDAPPLATAFRDVLKRSLGQKS
ncbi:MAG: flagellar biosynthetic protein FliO [Nevskia sp.]|nr:flagellar biosynthetic protein FliO [Nevskia sp.]